jgi:hypothetical protein
VVTRRVDVPSPQFPGLWQQGLIGGYFYTLFANGEGLLQSSRETPDWAITFSCDAETGTCNRTQSEGTAPAEASAIVHQLEQCMNGIEVTTEPPAPQVAEPPAPTVEEPPAPTVTEPIEPTVVEAAPPPCGLKAIPEGAEGLTVQRLVVLAGADPGPLDGYPGKLTQTAIAQLLGPKANGLSLADTIIALDQLLCSGAAK